MSKALRTASQVMDYVRQTLDAGVALPRHPWHWPALATALDNRIVVLRAVDIGANTLDWYTDRRSDKMTQLSEDPSVVLLFYHGEERRQLRLYGTAQEVTDIDERTRLWAQVSAKAKANYLTDHAPGTIIPSPTSDLPAEWLDPTDELAAKAFATFCVLRTTIGRADFLQLLPDGSALRCGWEAHDRLGTFCWKAP